MKVLMWLLLGVLVYFALRKNFKSTFTKNPPPASAWQSPVLDPEQGTGAAVEDMVCCLHCQIHIPASEAIMRGNAAYCCLEHADSIDIIHSTERVDPPNRNP